MKLITCLFFMTYSAFGQDSASYLKAFDDKVYSLKSKGTQEFVVDIESTKLTKQLSDMQLFGKIDEVIFRTYWTSKPERLAIEVIGMPEGFKEIKENLKSSILGIMDNLIPPTSVQRFAGYKFEPMSGKKEILAKDTSGLASIPSFTLKFDPQDKLIEIVGNRAIGTFNSVPVYEKTSFSGGSWVLTQQTITSYENGQTMVTKKDLEYEKSNGIGVLKEVNITTTQTVSDPKAKPMTFSESLNFKNYKINEGVAQKYFLGESKAASEQTDP